MLCSLDANCLHEICNYLSLQDHLALAQVCEHFECLVESRLWTAQRLIEQDHRVSWLKWELMRADRPNMYPRNYGSGELKCEAAHLLKMKDSLAFFLFTGITSLQIQGLELETMDENDELEQLIATIFPDLMKLQSSISLSGKYIARLTELTDITFETSNVNENFIEHLKALKLKRLSFAKSLEVWEQLTELKSFDQLVELKMSAQNYEKLSELPDFKLPESLTSLTLTAATEKTKFKLNEDFKAQIESVNLRICLVLSTAFSYDSVRSVLTHLRGIVTATDDVKTINELYKAYPMRWETLERVFYLDESHEASDEDLLEDELLELSRLILHKQEEMGFNNDKRLAMGLLTRNRPKRVIIRWRNILPEHEQFVPRRLNVLIAFEA